MKETKCAGWTLLETVVVVVVLAGLLALAIPGLLRARETARREQCQEHLKRLAQGLDSYHQAHQMLPPAGFCGAVPTLLTSQCSDDRHYQLRTFSANWVILLLPYLGQEKMAALFDLGVPVIDPVNAAGRATEIGFLKCASDSFSRPANHYVATTLQGSTCEFARGNYAMNLGVSGVKPFFPGTPWEPQPHGVVAILGGTPEAPTFQAWSNGIGGLNKCFCYDDMPNGRGSIVALEEIRAGLTPDDCRGVWALGEIGASATCGHGLIGDANGPNCRRPRSDDCVGCNQLHAVYGEEGLVAQGMPCCPYEPQGAQATARSLHPGGVNLVMLDGSVRFVSDAIDGSIWHALHSRESREFQPPEPSADDTVALPKDEAAPAVVQPKAAMPEGVRAQVNALGMTLVRIPAGEFVMGLPDEGRDPKTPGSNIPPEVPAHPVRISKDLWIGAFEVTQQQYARIMGNNPCWYTAQGGGSQQVAGQDTAQYPAESISWSDAVRFCQRLSALPAEKEAGRRYRLPTEAEWEYACRAGSRKPFVVPFGSAADAVGFNMRPDALEGLPVGPVGAYPPNAFGLYDMRGNVYEWCQDWFAWDYYAQSPKDDPAGPDSGILKVVRGADWRFTGMKCGYTRFDTDPWRISPFIGFRVVAEEEK